MAKKSNGKNIIITNLPAAALLILMATALKMTLHFSFFISLIVLIVAYFVFGVLIELILDKLDARKKKENLFRHYAEGEETHSSPKKVLPFEERKTARTGTLFSSNEAFSLADLQTDGEVEEYEEVLREKDSAMPGTVSVEPIYQTEEEEYPAFLRTTEEAPEESAADQEEEKAAEPERSRFTDAGNTVSEDSAPLTEDEKAIPGADDDFLNIKINDLKKPAKNESETEQLFLRMVADNNAAIEKEEKTFRKTPEQAEEEKREAEEASAVMASEITQAEGPRAAEEWELPNTAEPVSREEENAVTEPVHEEPEGIVTEPISEEEKAGGKSPARAADAATDHSESETMHWQPAVREEAETESLMDAFAAEEPLTGSEESETEESENSETASGEDAAESDAETESVAEEISEGRSQAEDEELAAALQDVTPTAEPEPEEIPEAEAEARRSLFSEEDDFDAYFEEHGKRNPSVIFGSVPDTEDDLEYIPESDISETPVVRQKGKVQVDPKKIDDLYAFKKTKQGKTFFHRRK